MSEGRHPNTGVPIGSIVCLERFFKYAGPPLIGDGMGGSSD